MLELTSLKELLANPQHIVITTHHKPDGDAMGSSLGLYNYLIQKGHHVRVITPTDYPLFLHWMPNNPEVIPKPWQNQINILAMPILYFALTSMRFLE